MALKLVQDAVPTLVPQEAGNAREPQRHWLRAHSTQQALQELSSCLAPTQLPSHLPVVTAGQGWDLPPVGTTELGGTLRPSPWLTRKPATSPPSSGTRDTSGMLPRRSW